MSRTGCGQFAHRSGVIGGGRACEDAAMYAVATFLVVAVITVAFTKLATGALIATGVPPESAAFQARSAFSGAGFTTTEAENVVNHRVRRRIIGTTMFVGSLGTPTLVLTVLVGFVAPGPGSTTERALRDDLRSVPDRDGRVQQAVAAMAAGHRAALRAGPTRPGVVG